MKLDQRKMQPFYVSAVTPPSVSAHGIVNSLSRDVYVSIDLDVFELSIMPAVGTPEPGGMQWDEVLSLLGSVTLHKHVVGFDLVELCPTEGTASCAFLADKAAYRLIGYAMSQETEMKASFNLGRVFGIPVRLHYT